MKKYFLIAVCVLVVIAIALLLIKGKGASDRSPTPRDEFSLAQVPEMIADFYRPFFQSVTKTKSEFQHVGESLKTLDVVTMENKKLSEEITLLRIENERFQEMVKENDRLRDMLSFVRNSPFKLVASRIIARDASIWWQGLMLDKGFGDVQELEMNMPVITPDGLVGKITTVSKYSSSMLMLIDENCKVAAVIRDNGEHGIVMGTRESTELNPILRMTYLSRNANLKPGMEVITSGLGGVFPQGIRIGTIAEVRDVTTSGTLGLYKEAIIQPSVNLANLEFVFILVDIDKTSRRR